ncbi:MAG: transcriptional regulator GcvA [Pseudomonadota bacterium]
MRLPSLNALRAFSVAGHHLSFTKTADELNVTQAAVSHQIKTLEDQLGIKLFRREPRGLVLTEAGQAYLTPVRDAFDRLVAATDRLHTRDASGILTVSVLPSFAARWLVPRLRRFQAAHPEIDLRVAAEDRLTEFDRDGVDVAIRYGGGNYRGLRTLALFGESFFPVCSPSLLEGANPLREPSDLRHHTLLHDDVRTDWPMWLLAAGIGGDVDANRGLTFNDSSLLLQAAVDGQGVALGRSTLVADDIAAGRLVSPFTISLPSHYGYYLVYPEGYVSRPKVQAFGNWLLQEAQSQAQEGVDVEHDGTAP